MLASSPADAGRVVVRTGVAAALGTTIADQPRGA